MIYISIDSFVNTLKERFSACSDFAIRESTTNFGDKFYVLYIINLCEKQYITESILKSICYSNVPLCLDSVPRILASLPLSECNGIDDAVEKILSGSAVICGGGESLFLYAVDSKNDSGRGISEPDSESVVRGPRQGFIESAEANVTMIRKIIKSPLLKVVSIKCGDKTNTNIKVVYYEGIARNDVVSTVISEIKSININSCVDSGYLEKALSKNKFSFFSMLGNSEKVDKVASKILSGRIAVICDGSPVVLTAPYLFVESIQSSEDYLKNIYYAIFVRILRIIGMIISVYLPAIYIAIMEFHKGAVPYSMLVAQNSSRSNIPFDIFSELFIVLVIFELIREVGIRMPRAVGDAVGIVGGLILGDAAIKAGIASETVIMISALSAISNFMNPTYMNINVIFRFLNLILAKVLGFFGIALVFMPLLCYVCNLRSFGVPFMSPFAPIKDNILIDSIILNPQKALTETKNELCKNGRK